MQPSTKKLRARQDAAICTSAVTDEQKGVHTKKELKARMGAGSCVRKGQAHNGSPMHSAAKQHKSPGPQQDSTQAACRLQPWPQDMRCVRFRGRPQHTTQGRLAVRHIPSRAAASGTVCFLRGQPPRHPPHPAVKEPPGPARTLCRQISAQAAAGMTRHTEDSQEHTPWAPRAPRVKPFKKQCGSQSCNTKPNQATPNHTD